MKKLTSKQLTVITNNINADKEIMKQINSNTYTSVESFIENAARYINAINDRRMSCVIRSVSNSGMSRVLSFHSFEPLKGKKEGNYTQYYTLFKQLGYTETKNGFRISGCGMDMIFHTNYTIIHKLHRLGFISRPECDKLAQQTPTNLS